MAATTKSLIAFFSRKGNNYVDSRIVNLPIGNTEVAAQMIQKLAGGDLFRIETVKDYPSDYEETTDVARQELRQKARPELAGRMDKMADYTVIFLGYPNWWGTMPMAVFTFLEAYDFSGKTIIPLGQQDPNHPVTFGTRIEVTLIKAIEKDLSTEKVTGTISIFDAVGNTILDRQPMSRDLVRTKIFKNWDGKTSKGTFAGGGTYLAKVVVFDQVLNKTEVSRQAVGVKQ